VPARPLTGRFLGLGRDFPSPTWAGFAARSMPTARSDRMAALLSRMNKTQVDTLHWNPSSFCLLLFSLSRRTEQASTGSRRASAAVSPLSVARAHRWVDAPALSGITVWLTDSASFSAVEGPSPSSSRTARQRPTQGAALQVEASSARRRRLGHLPAQKQWSASMAAQLLPVRWF
jgi:hypothetical protein